MTFRLTIDIEPAAGERLTLWDIAHNVPCLIALALSEIRPADVTRLYLRRLDGPSIAAALEGGEEIDIREFLGS
jgi:hypothetical protein